MQILPADIVNRSLDALGAGTTLGDLSDGSDASEAARRVYGPTLRQLLRAAHWSFARKLADLTLLGDASGAAVTAPVVAIVEPPWQYAYAWPLDGVGARWMPYNQSPSASAVPLMTNLSSVAPTAYTRPARFLVTSSDQYPVVTGEANWDELPDLAGTEGVGYTSRRVVLSNLAQASLVYTKLVLQIEEWDPLFGEAMVAVLAARLALPVLVKPEAPAQLQLAQRKEALAVRGQQILIAKDMLREARAASANDSGFPQTLDHTPDWIRARSGNYRAGGDIGGPGYLYCDCTPMGFADGSVF